MLGWAYRSRVCIIGAFRVMWLAVLALLLPVHRFLMGFLKWYPLYQLAFCVEDHVVVFWL